MIQTANKRLQNNPMTDKQTRFADEYLSNGMNATQAAIAAGYSANSARAKGSQLLKIESVSDFIQSRQKLTSQRLDIKRETLIKSNLEIRDKAIADKNYAAAGARNDAIAKMLGFNEPEKFGLSGGGTIKITVGGEEI